MKIQKLLKLNPFSLSQLREISHSYLHELGEALQGRSKALVNFNSSLLPATIPKINLDVEILCVDIAGSHLRVAINQIKIISGKIVVNKILASEVSHWSIKNLELLQFIDQTSLVITNFLRQNKSYHPEYFGISFSFPFTPRKVGHLIDADRSGYSDFWGKGFHIGHSQQNITKLLREKLAKQGYVFSHWITVNDTVALQVACPGSIVGIVVGTGFNLSVTGEKQIIYNTQSQIYQEEVITRLASLPAEQYLKYLMNNQAGSFAEASTAINEIQISGKFLPKLLLEALQFLQLGNSEIYQIIETEEAAIFQKIFSKEDLSILFKQNLGLEMQAQIRLISDLLFTRSRDLVAAETAGAIMFARKYQLHSGKSIVAVDGAFFQKISGYLFEVEQKIQKILGDNQIELQLVHNSSLLGAGLATSVAQ
ncbi:MAG: hypothetical protein WCJ58_03260 [bacterium]